MAQAAHDNGGPMAVQALVADPTIPVTMRMAEIPEPEPALDQVVIEVHHVSLNHGDLNDARSGRIPPGGVLGSDVAGVVVRAVGDGSGPAEGARVVALAEGGFAERVAVGVASVAEVPEWVSLRAAAALPVAGLAALRSLRACGSLLGKRALVTGASGGVGRFAVQLAAAAGAHVVASVGSSERMVGLSDLGADDVVVGLEGVDSPVHAVIDAVGGQQMVEAWGLLAPGGKLQSIGWTSGEPAVFQPYSTVGPAKSLSSYLTYAPCDEDLAILVELVGARELEVPVSWSGSWERFAEVLEAMRERRVDGKAVLDVAGQADTRPRAEAAVGGTS
jgi:NADPH:quinone reductase-like Zn-dependent oxidoreductase